MDLSQTQLATMTDSALSTVAELEAGRNVGFHRVVAALNALDRLARVNKNEVVRTDMREAFLRDLLLDAALLIKDGRHYWAGESDKEIDMEDIARKLYGEGK